MDEQQVMSKMSSIARFFYETLPNYDVAGFAVFFVILLMSIIVYNLGFARKLKFGQNVVIYLFLALGSLLLTFLSFFLPVIEGLIVIALVLIVYRIRRRLEKKSSVA